MRVKLSTDHGFWYGFLFKANIYPSTATRRIQTAVLFMQWADISFPDYKPSLEEAVIAINLADAKSCMLHDFTVAQKIDIDGFWDELHKRDNKYLPPQEGPQEHIIIVPLNPSWKKIEEFILHKYKRLCKEKKLEFREWLQMQATRAYTLVQLTQDVDKGLSVKRSHPKMITGQDVLVDDADKPNYPTPK